MTTNFVNETRKLILESDAADMANEAAGVTLTSNYPASSRKVMAAIFKVMILKGVALADAHPKDSDERR